MLKLNNKSKKNYKFISANYIGANHSNKKSKLYKLKIISLCFLAILIISLQTDIDRYQVIRQRFQMKNLDIEEFRAMDISKKAMKYIKKKSKQLNIDYIKVIAFNMIYHNYHIKDTKDIIWDIDKYKQCINGNLYQSLYSKYKCLLTDIMYFPIPYNEEEKAYVYFDDSWKSTRTYGGTRFHEGTDIMSSNNIRGYFPVLSISEGVVEKIGWLEQGGYRIGIRAKNGAYFYYAHLYSYAQNIKEGDTVLAGQLLGFMGDTGYSKIEGTTGNFDVHLHVGIYFDENGKELSVNPYWILKYLEDNRLSYTY